MISIYLQLNDENSIAYIQQDLDNLKKWSKANGLEYNHKKSFSILFSKTSVANSHILEINNNILENVNSIKDLGIIFHSDLQFEKHMTTSFFYFKHFNFTYKVI